MIPQETHSHIHTVKDSHTANARQLAEHHLGYLAARGVTREVAEAVGYFTARKPSEIPDAFSKHQRRRTPTLVAPHHSPDGVTVTHQKHDDHPGRDRRGNIIKWASPPGDKAPMVLSVHPWQADEVRHGTGPLWVCEGKTRGDALAGLDEPAVTYAGCWSWQKGGRALACWNHVNVEGRTIYDVPDADAQTNENVQLAQARRVEYLESREATVLVVSVPEVDGDPTAGLDDYLAAGGDLEALVRDARPFEPVDVGRERVRRDGTLAEFIAEKLREIEEVPAPTETACNGIGIARWMLENAAPAHGKRTPRGLEVHPSYPQIAEGTRIGSFQTVRKALDWLKEMEVLKVERAPRGSRLASVYVLPYPSGGGSAKGVNKGTRGEQGRESQEQGGEGETPLHQRDSSSHLHSARGGGYRPCPTKLQARPHVRAASRQARGRAFGLHPPIRSQAGRDHPTRRRPRRGARGGATRPVRLPLVQTPRLSAPVPRTDAKGRRARDVWIHRLPCTGLGRGPRTG